MKLYTAIVNLPEISHSKHAVIAEEMRRYQGKMIIIEEMEDYDYDFKSYHSVSKKLWWWSKKWLNNVEILLEQSHRKGILKLDDNKSNGVISDEKERQELAIVFQYLISQYSYRYKPKSIDVSLMSKELFQDKKIEIAEEIIKKALKIYGYSVKKILNT